MIKHSKYKKLDWQLIIAYFLLVIIGWVSVFSSVYDPDHNQIFDISQRYGMQLVWIVSSLIIATIILFGINPKLYNVTAWFLFIITTILLIAVIVMGVEVNGSKSWLMIGPVRFQPAEFSKIATALALSSLLSSYNFRLKSFSGLSKVALTIIFPMLLIILEKETGSALVYFGFVFMLYREGLSGWYLIFGLLAIIIFLITLSFSSFVAIIFVFCVIVITRAIISRQILSHALFLLIYLPILIYSGKLGEMPLFSDFSHWSDTAWLGIFLVPPFIYQIVIALKQKIAHYWYLIICFIISIALIYSVDFFFEKVLQEHQRVRIESLLGIHVDLKGAGYNVHQSKIAIGSGGFSGKGFLQGTQTKFNFVPEQSTDFIFCTVGEEWGFIGSFIVIFIYCFMIIRIISLAEKQKDNFTRIYGYCVASVIFLHFFINIGMTIGLVPVIGIPLPFVSYGGSSLWSFTIFLFVFIRLDLERWK
jgi:rod shape determining protein RodA